MQKCANVMIDIALKKLLRFKEKDNSSPFVPCSLMNETICEPTQQLITETDGTVFMVVYNPLGYMRTERVRIPITNVDGIHAKVTSLSKNVTVHSAILPSTAWASKAQQQSLNSLPVYPKLAANSLVFDVDIPPHGFSTYGIHFSRRAIAEKQTAQPRRSVFREPFSLENDLVRLDFDIEGAIIKLTNKKEKLSTAITQGFYYYTANHSGPWMLRPDQSAPGEAYCIGKCNKPERVEVISSQVDGRVLEVVQMFSNWTTQTIRLLPGEDTIELEWTVGPVPISDNVSKEVFSRFTTEIR